MLLGHDNPDGSRNAAAAGRGGVFAPAWGALSDAELLQYFATRAGQPHPPLPAPSPEQLRNADRVLAGEFLLVGETHRLGRAFSWAHNPSRDKEWQIAQHKFYFVVDLIQAWRVTGDSRYLEAWIDLTRSWLDEMGTGFIAASDAQVEAKRVEHWVTAFLLLQGSDWAKRVPAAFLRRFLSRIGEEAWYITQHLRPSRNHRTFQLYTVFLVGVQFPEFQQHAHFVEHSRSLLSANLLSDFGPDGVHIELSTHYHQITLETALAFVELAQLNDIVLAPALLVRLRQALHFSLCIAWPDGSMPLINDSDDGDHLPLLRQGARLFRDPHLLWAASAGSAGDPPPAVSHHFEDSGYFVMSNTWGSDTASYAARQHLFYDCAKLGEGSHSHYDAFNFCYFAGGEPLVVDPGRYTYNADPDAQNIDWRREFKSTRYHNTVCIDGLDQTRYLSKSNNPPPGVERYERTRHALKHGPDAEVLDMHHALGGVCDWVWGSVRSREYSPVHTRTLVFMARQYLFLFDHVRIEDDRNHECALRFHLDARWHDRVELRASADDVKVTAPGWQIRALRAPTLAAAIEPGWVSRSYGVKQPAPVVTFTKHASASLCFATVVAHQRAVPGGLSIRRLRRLGADGACSIVFQVEGEAGGAAFTDRFVFQPDIMGDYRDEQVRYRGRFLAYRRDGAGRFDFLCAAHPEALVLEQVPAVKRSMRGHVEWRSPRREA